MAWTNEQNSVFDARSENILVSASAGCGKTAVMVERIFRYLANGGSIKRLVVITFTRAAADEMKDKLSDVIYSKIRSGLVADPIHLGEQARAIAYSYIGTIDKFCADIYRRHFEDLPEGDPSFTIIEEKEADALFNESVDEVITRRLQLEENIDESLQNSDAPSFFALLDSLSAHRTNDAFKVLMRDVYGFLSVRPDPTAFIEKVKEVALGDPVVSPAVLYALEYFRKQAGKLIELYNNKIMRSLDDIPDARNFLKKQLEVADHCLEMIRQVGLANDLAGMIKLTSFKSTSCPALKDASLEQVYLDFFEKLEMWIARVGDFIKGLKDTFKFDDAIDAYSEAVNREISANASHSLILDVAWDVRTLYAEKKKEKNYLDFNDTERFALNVLSDETRAQSMADEIDAVYMDEYQDTNYLQDAVISKIATNGAFMVGDVKQSIYGFRYAEPEIFLEKKELYDKDKNAGSSLLLNGNFRSCAPVLDFVNKIFDHVLTYDFGGIDYAKEARLNANLETSVPDERFPSVSTRFFVKEAQTNRDYPDVYSVRDDSAKEDVELTEGMYIADRILKAVGRMNIFDRKKKEYRKLRYDDIAIIVRKRGPDVVNIARALKDAGIPCRTGGLAGDDFGDIDIKLLISLIQVIDNYMNDVPLYAVMSSYLGGFTREELAEFRREAKKSKMRSSTGRAIFYWEAVVGYSAINDLGRKRDAFFEFLSRFRKLSQVISAAQLLDAILAETGFDGYLLSRGVERIAAVNAFIYKVKQTGRGCGIREFLSVYDPNGDGGTSIDIDLSSSGEDCVCFYTVHRSKGLEFPMVFLAACDQSIDKTSLPKKDVLFDDKLGMAFKWRNTQTRRKGETISFRAIRLKKEMSIKEEQARLLYVALTRAECRLCVTGMEPKEREFVEDCSTFAELIRFAEMQDSKIMSYRDTEDFETNSAKAEKSVVGFIKEKVAPIQIQYHYPYQASVPIANKYSVSLINKEYTLGDTADIEYIPGIESLTAEMGTEYHKYLEICDFNVRTSYEIAEAIKSFASDGKLSNPELINPSLLERVLNHQIFDTVRCASNKLLRERKFLLYLPAREILQCESDDKILIQGAIDMLVVGEQKLLIDFKVSNLPPERLKIKYRRQVEIYAIAAERLFNIKPDSVIIFVIGSNGGYPIYLD
ncbi:MAG: UvrD-helicase domain-containing protein [Christensenellaceae bacterium]|jgi:ATP-dependent helicase/nuclease subunit A|nr:UvrD-helicase domain-containing protein [Christensenellaceae bacterium]